MRLTRFASTVVPVLVLGCGGARPVTAEDPGSRHAAEHAGEVAGPGAGAATTDCSDWRSWTKVNSARFLSKGHGGKWVDVYVEPRFVAAYKDGKNTSHAVGMRIVKAGYKDEGGTDFEALTVMGKMAPGYDPDHGDWYYGVLMDDGRTARMQGKLDMCIHCHAEADRDYLFGADGK